MTDRVNDRGPMVQRDDPEPQELGVTLSTGARPGQGDGVTFIRVGDGDRPWLKRVNGVDAGRVGWDSVRFWAPLRLT